MVRLVCHIFTVAVASPCAINGYRMIENWFGRLLPPRKQPIRLREVSRTVARLAAVADRMPPLPESEKK